MSNLKSSEKIKNLAVVLNGVDKTGSYGYSYSNGYGYDQDYSYGYSSGYLTAFNSEMKLGGSLSEKIMEEMKAQNMSFIEYGLSQSQGIASTFLQTANRDFSRFIDSSKASLQELKKVEESSSMDINKYVELYNSKLKEEK